jgi:hypothetical protein
MLGESIFNIISCTKTLNCLHFWQKALSVNVKSRLNSLEKAQRPESWLPQLIKRSKPFSKSDQYAETKQDNSLGRLL